METEKSDSNVLGIADIEELEDKTAPGVLHGIHANPEMDVEG